MADDKKTDNGKRADDKKTERHTADDMTPAPTQAELDGLAGEKDRKAEPRKAPEATTPTPTQAENDEFKAKVYGVEVEKRSEAKKDAKAAEDLTPTPTQAENDAAKLAAMYVPQDDQEQKSGQSQQHRRNIEASRPGAGYETRATAKAE